MSSGHQACTSQRRSGRPRRLVEDQRRDADDGEDGDEDDDGVSGPAPGSPRPPQEAPAGPALVPEERDDLAAAVLMPIVVMLVVTPGMVTTSEVVPAE